MRFPEYRVDTIHIFKILNALSVSKNSHGKTKYP